MDEPELKDASDAIKLMGDWSRWLVSLLTVATTVLGVVLPREGHGARGGTIRILIAAALIALLASVFFATILLYKLPGVVQELRRAAPGADVYCLGARSTWPRFDTGTLVWWQQVCFFLGLALLIAAIVTKTLSG